MARFRTCIVVLASLFALSLFARSAYSQGDTPKKFSAIAFYTGTSDEAHISFVGEAKKWFPEQAAKHGFAFESTKDWNRLNAEELAKHQVVIFLDTRAPEPQQRKAFQDFMEAGGAWMGFHFAGFAMNKSDYPQDWDWYHDNFLGADQFVSNTWRPTSAILKVEVKDHPSTAGLPDTFKTQPSEWYRWRGELRKNPDIKVLLSIDPSSFPLGTKPDETWHSGDFPVVWTNTRYRMIYFNFGHNDIDYEGKFLKAANKYADDKKEKNKDLSRTFEGNENQDKLILNSLLWLGNKESK